MGGVDWFARKAHFSARGQHDQAIPPLINAKLNYLGESMSGQVWSGGGVDRSGGSRRVVGEKGVVCIPPQKRSPLMLHNNSAVSGNVGREEAAHLHRNGSRYEGVRS